jgi:NAD(P)H dehydrogenase (quinone)
MLHADTSTTSLAPAHHATEQYLRDRIPSVMLRNGWYLENYTAQLPAYLEHGAVSGAAGGGRISAASRADFAAADVAALLESKGGEVYELGGDEAFTLTELAAEVSRQSGKQVVYNDLPTDAFAELLAAVGVPVPFNEVLADVDRAIRDGELYIATGSLSELTGRPTTSQADAIKAAL